MPRQLAMEASKLRAYLLAWAGKKTLHTMSKETRCTYKTIQIYADELGLKLEVKEKLDRKINIDETIARQHAEKTALELSLMLRISRQTVYTIGRRMGLKFKPANAYAPKNTTIEDGDFFNHRKYENWIAY
jgi:hypothetical protein